MATNSELPEASADPPEEPATSVRIGERVLQLRGREVILDGQPVSIGGRAFAVLSVLLRERHRVVGKAELLEAAWPGLVVEENNLQVQIGNLRRLLGRNAIATIPALGYQFNPPRAAAGQALGGVDGNCASPDPVTPESPSAEARSPGAPLSRRRQALVGAFLLALGVGAWRLRSAALPEHGPPSLGAAGEDLPDRSVAVLAFADMSEQHNLQYFSDGLSEEILNLLGRVPDLRVAAGTSSFSFRGSREDLPSIARKLHVGTILEGSVRRAGGHWRITARLVRADSGFELWSETYERRMSDAFRVQEEIAAAVVQALNVSLVGESMPQAGAARRDTYTLYTLGRSLQSRASTPEEWRKAADLARRCVAADAAFAPGWALLASVLQEQACLGFASDADAWSQARDAALQAIVLDSTLPDGRAAMAAILIRRDWNWPAAQRQLDWILERLPHNGTAMSWAGYLALAMGRNDRAIALFEGAVEGDPADPQKCNLLAQALLYSGRLAEARAAAEKALALDDDLPFSHGILARVALADGDAAGACRELDAEPNERVRLAGRAIALHALDRADESQAVLRDLERGHGWSAPAQVALVHAGLGDRRSALEWLERACRQHDPGCVLIKVEPMFQDIRTEPRYLALLRRMKLAS